MKANLKNEQVVARIKENAEQSILVHVFDSIILPTFVIDTHHTILYWNKALEKLSGLRKEDMIGTKNQWRPFYNEPRPCLADLMLENNQNNKIEQLYAGKYEKSELIDGAYEAEDFFPECGDNGEWLHFSASTIRNDSGSVIGAIETFTNISDRKNAEFELKVREESYRKLSITDMLTGLKNTRYFYIKLEEFMAAANRYQHNFSICFLDLDHFKKLNDTHGHLAGDKVLRTIGQILQSSLRKLDIGCRYGGEEFVILLPSTSKKGAELVAQRIREWIENHKFALSKELTINVTVSIGISEYKEGDTNKSLLERADSALYEAKSSGRNRVILI